LRIAVVVPIIKRVHGNRLSLCLARELSRAHDVTVYTETALESIVPEVQKQVAPAGFRVLRTTINPRLSNLELLRRQLQRGPDRRISNALIADHRTNAFDWIVVFADEGHWIADYVSSWSGSKRPRTALVLMDPIEQIFLLSRDRPFVAARHLMMPLYPPLHWIESLRIREFDNVYSISRWTSELSSFLYGIGPTISLAAVDADLFKCPSGIDDSEPYVAVPTVSLRPADDKLVTDISRRGIPVVTFGPRGIPGIPHRGFLSDSELVSFLAGARSTLFLFDYEGLGLLPLESLAVGTPVITLPDGGPFVELRDNPFVQFADDEGSLAQLCEQSLGKSRSARDCNQIRSSVRDYFASAVAVRWSRTLDVPGAPAKL
jgi:glycosyltransferase involved in cell wall biosynthesis